MGTNSVRFVADLFLFCYEREKQSDVIDAFSSTSRYFEDLLNIDNMSSTV